MIWGACVAGLGSGGLNAERIAQRIVRAPKADSIHQSEGINPCTKNYPPEKIQATISGAELRDWGTHPIPLWTVVVMF